MADFVDHWLENPQDPELDMDLLRILAKHAAAEPLNERDLATELLDVARRRAVSLTHAD